ncbi:uncharacterized protein ASCRUDRAFT_77025 [Ascoidea rubescens DSM 1968]|uniref:Uncharacterized protein n=1 Tax=Ascoidea rubescens DSM 1968 TaxID=1344418 RepID=A0A1D2VD99_9ASCO|nr:hypothetical protein ASCRUDRAFT_77025 [Ascoidea rubescens DSM 1968]ODV59678.1 hypothetical protein ASCRUDRAFT_77025 [Ascoidea rubescens DSM 1968]
MSILQLSNSTEHIFRVSLHWYIKKILIKLDFRSAIPYYILKVAIELIVFDVAFP